MFLSAVDFVPAFEDLSYCAAVDACVYSVCYCLIQVGLTNVEQADTNLPCDCVLFLTRP